jgi:hypothetical protein
MATSSSGVNALYEDVVASLISFYDNAVLLPSPGILTNVYNISGGLGDTVKVPITNFWLPGVTVGEGDSVITAATDGSIASDFNPGSITITAAKRGAGTYVNEEALEDGGLATVRSAVLTRLSRQLAQATDVAGFNQLIHGSDATPANANVVLTGGLTNDGQSNVATYGGTSAVSLVMSPEALAYMMKREPTVKMFNDVDRDRYEMVATIRNAFARIPFSRSGSPAYFARAIIGSDSFDAANADAAQGAVSLSMISKSVANLRAVNAPTDAAGFYLAAVTAAHEFHLAKELNGVGGISSGAIGSVSQDLANQALLDALIGQAVGCRFVRSNNLPTGLADA